VTFNVKDADGQEYTLLDGVKSGVGGLSVHDRGNGNYEGMYSWDPTDAQPLGFYDLAAEIEDKNGAKVADGFANNPDELEILKKPDRPVLDAGDTTAEPDLVETLGSGTTEISITWTHGDDLSIDDFKVTFTVRDPGNIQTPLITQATNGTNGFSIERTDVGTYRAKFTWDPPSDQGLGTYDLYVLVEDLNGFTAVDGFDNNREELTLEKGTGGGPAIIDGRVMDKKGNGIGGAIVVLYSNGTCNQIAVTGTDNAGLFVFRDLPLGTYDIEVTAVDYHPGRVWSFNTVSGTNQVDDIVLTGIDDKPDGGQGEIVPPGLWAVVIILLLVLLLLVAMLVMRSRGPKPEQETSKPDGKIKTTKDEEPEPISSDEVRVEKED
jgi:hypothetical protein